MTRLEFTPDGKAEDYYIVYRDGDGRMHARAVRHPWECLSSGWGPTGMLAVMNPENNVGLVWELSNEQNGCWLRVTKPAVSTSEAMFAFDLYGRRANFERGEVAEHHETVTIVRNVSQWCKQNNVPWPLAHSN